MGKIACVESKVEKSTHLAMWLYISHVGGNFFVWREGEGGRGIDILGATKRPWE